MKLTSLKNKVKGAVSYNNRRCFSANGFSLLPLALRPRLFSWVGMIAGVALVLMMGCVINPPKSALQTYADDPVPVEDPSITISTAGTIAANLAPTSSSGSFASASGTFSVTTTNETGYTLKIKSTDNGTDLKYTDINNNNVVYIIPTLNANTTISESDFSTSSTYNNKWGYKPSKLNSAANNDYKPAPSINGDTLDVTDVANMVANDYTVSLGARADVSTKPGSYSNTFVIEATANVVLDLLTVNFDGNGLLMNGAATNTVRYDSDTIVSYEKYVHTDNFIDMVDVPFNEYYNEESSRSIVISGAEYMDINLKYGIGNDPEDEYSYDYLFVIEGDFGGDDMFASDLYQALVYDCASDVECLTELIGDNASLLGVYTGSPDTNDFTDPSTASIRVNGNAVTFVLYGRYPGMYLDDAYGYYATVEGYDSNDNPIQVGEVFNRTVETGTYAEPVVPAGQIFYGWGTDPDATSVYINEGNIKVNMPGDNGDVVTLYALYGACPVGVICYNSNNATSNTAMADQNIEVSGDTTLWASNFWKTGYGFAGWNSKPDGTGKNYGPNETVDISNTIGLTLYANWVPSAGDLQGWSGCDNMNVGGVTALKDTRDNQVYAVAKLVDGKCWMIENLRLNTAGSDDGTKAQGFGGEFEGLANPEIANFSNSTTANSLYSTANIVGNNQSFRFPRYNNMNTASTVSNMTSTNSNIYSYGNYYTWAAAIANTNYYDSVATSEAANTSICPSGWRLPYGRDVGNGNAPGGFYYLNYMLNDGLLDTGDVAASNRLRAYPNNFVCSGNYSGSSVRERGNEGDYWSITTSGKAYYTGYAHYLTFYLTTGGGGFVNPGSGDNPKYIGYSVRCVQGF